MSVTSPNGPIVMVVEDDLMIAETLEIALESRDYRILGPVSTLEQAQQLLETSAPDIALIDYRLATTTTEALLSSLNSRHIPICVLTGADELPATYAGCTVLQKPFRLNALLDALQQSRPH